LGAWWERIPCGNSKAKGKVKGDIMENVECKMQIDE
jgi:hypothetical protein